MIQRALQAVGLAAAPAPAIVYNGPDHTATLPVDVLRLILEPLSPRSLAACLSVNRHWNEAASGDGLWRLACRHLYPVSTKPAAESFKDYFYACQNGARILTGNCWSSRIFCSTTQGNINGMMLSDRHVYMLRNRRVFAFERDAPANQIQFMGHTGRVTCMHHYEGRLVTGSIDTQVRVWDAENGDLLQQLTGHEGAITCVQMTNLGAFSGSDDSSVKHWSANGIVINSFMHESGPVTCLQVKNGRIYSGSTGGVYEWGVVSGTQLRMFPAPWPRPVFALQVTEDRLYIGQGVSVQMIDLENGVKLNRVHEADQRLSCMQVIGRFVFVGSRNGTLQVMDMLNGTRLQFLTVRPAGVSFLHVVGDQIFHGDGTRKIMVSEIKPGEQEGWLCRNMGPKNLLAPLQDDKIDASYV